VGSLDGLELAGFGLYTVTGIEPGQSAMTQWRVLGEALLHERIDA